MKDKERLALAILFAAFAWAAWMALLLHGCAYECAGATADPNWGCPTAEIIKLRRQLLEQYEEAYGPMSDPGRVCYLSGPDAYREEPDMDVVRKLCGEGKVGCYLWTRHGNRIVIGDWTNDAAALRMSKLHELLHLLLDCERDERGHTEPFGTLLGWFGVPEAERM